MQCRVEQVYVGDCSVCGVAMRPEEVYAYYVCIDCAVDQIAREAERLSGRGPSVEAAVTGSSRDPKYRTKRRSADVVGGERHGR